MKMAKDLRDKISGMFFGLAIADAIGVPYEFKTKHFYE
jgi:ADP-ribosylglycohydrolase